MKFYRRKRGPRRNHLFLIAFRNFPGGLLKTGIGITLLAAPFLLTIFSDLGVKSLSERIALNGLIIVLVPTSVLYIITLFRAPKIRRRNEADAESQSEALTSGLNALKLREQKEEKEIVRLQEVVTSDIAERRVKDLKEEERWELLNERLRVAEETGKQNTNLKEEREAARLESESDERLLVAQQVKDLKDEQETAQKEIASTDLIAQGVKDRKEDERWEILNEKLRAQNEKGQQNIDERETARQELASDDLLAQQVKDLREDERWDLLNERLRVQEAAGEQNKDEREEREVARQEQTASVDLKAQQIKDLKEDERWEMLNETLRLRQVEASKRSVAQKEEQELVRQTLATGVLKAQEDKNEEDDERWNILHERLRVQEEGSKKRDAEQLHRDKEQRELREQDQLQEKYERLLTRYIRFAEREDLSPDVADGLAPIPDAWLKLQPEILKDPSLYKAMAALNKP